MAGTRPTSKNTLITISYWRDVASLHASAFGPAHQAGWDWWNRTRKEFPHLGIIHEVYVVKRGGFGATYVDAPAFGLGEYLLLCLVLVGKLRGGNGILSVEGIGFE